MNPEHVNETSDDELSRGFLEGPFFSEEEVTSHLGRVVAGSWVRFGAGLGRQTRSYR